MGTGILVRPVDLSFYPLVVPMPLALLGIMYAVYNVYYFFLEPYGRISYIGHMGGLLAGLLYGVRAVGMKKSLLVIIASMAILILLPFILRFLLVR